MSEHACPVGDIADANVGDVWACPSCDLEWRCTVVDEGLIGWERAGER